MQKQYYLRVCVIRSLKIIEVNDCGFKYHRGLLLLRAAEDKSVLGLLQYLQFTIEVSPVAVPNLNLKNFVSEG